ncbi:hypothetical protein OG455_34730 [Kitasatospora sp. NBC_01287]|uniref:hypothetical protein n=1 Tax=Kitasatospora sp. NBC_01287 TaxID=2903573 RepID=UPI0022578E0F|nr:hypothetical protein [Kitasatospora sp. NBC_01287]MCX4750605.1 hypothetical protein [Kitasatospora sp. NBC_01287]
MTPTASDSTGPNRTHPLARGLNLRTQVALTLTPTDATTMTAQGPEQPELAAMTTLEYGAICRRGAPCVLLPTPLAGDGAKGSPRQKGSKGDLSLPSAVAALGRPPDRAT